MVAALATVSSFHEPDTNNAMHIISTMEHQFGVKWPAEFAAVLEVRRHQRHRRADHVAAVGSHRPRPPVVVGAGQLANAARLRFG